MSLCLLRPGASGRSLGLDLEPALHWVHQTPGGPGGEGRGAVSHKDDATSDHLQRASTLQGEREEREGGLNVCALPPSRLWHAISTSLHALALPKV